MDISLNVEVHCPDGRCGRSTYVIINPATDQITHVVVREQWPSLTERMVPIDWIIVTTRDVMVLKYSRADFTQLDPFNQTDFIQRDIPQYATDPKLTLIWPYVVPAARIIDDVTRQIPPGELAVRRNAKVRATDGQVGQVDEFLIDPETGHITHLVLREGLPWDRKHINIPISEIDRLEENTVYLKLDKKSVGELPVIPLER